MTFSRLEFTQKWLRERLKYDPKTGVLTWRPRPRTDFSTDRGWKIWTARCSGRPAATFSPGETYPRVTLGGRRYTAHRVIWLLVTGKDAHGSIGHLNGNRSDNRFVNLVLNPPGRRVRVPRARA